MDQYQRHYLKHKAEVYHQLAHCWENGTVDRYSTCGQILSNFTEFSKGISLSQLRKERRRFAEGHEIRISILDDIRYKTRQTADNTFPFRGHIEKIGSSWDGSRVGNLDEVDTLFVLEDAQVQIRDSGDETFYVIWKGREYRPRQIQDRFAEALDKILRTESPPPRLQHGGYAAPEYSGNRINGPAVTVLFRRKVCDRENEHFQTLSLDITLAVPVSCLAENNEVQGEYSRWVDHVIFAVDTPLQLPQKPYLVPGYVDDTWKLSTAHFEAELLHELDTHSALKQGYLLLKVLSSKIENFNARYGFDLGTNQTNHPLHSAHQCAAHDLQSRSEDLRSSLMQRLRGSKGPTVGGCCHGREKLNRYMRHGHILIPACERKHYSELEYKELSMNTAAAKHVLLRAAQTEDFTAEIPNSDRVTELVLQTIEELVVQGSNVPAFIDNFPCVCKFSPHDSPPGRVAECARYVLTQYRVVLEVLRTQVSLSIDIVCLFNTPAQ